MSAKRAAPEPDDSDEWDPHGIVPADFLARYPEADTIREALKLAERETTADRFDREDRPRCPNEDCLSTRIRKKQDAVAEQPNRRSGDYKCWNCGCHFDTPAPPESEEKGKQERLAEREETEPKVGAVGRRSMRRQTQEQPGKQVTLGEVNDR